MDSTINSSISRLSICSMNDNQTAIVNNLKTLISVNPIRSGGGGALKAPPPPPIFCSHAFNFGAALLSVGDFSQKIV